jgi:hypothetical protein
MDELTPFEHEAIATIVRGNHPVFAGLRTQLARCQVSKREFTGVGFFTTLAVPSDVPSVPLRRRLDLGDVHVTMDGVEHGVGLVLFVEDGRLALLEAFTYDDPWPHEIANYTINTGGVTHLGGSPTDLEQIDAAWVRPDALT